MFIFVLVLGLVFVLVLVLVLVLVPVLSLGLLLVRVLVRPPFALFTQESVCLESQICLFLVQVKGQFLMIRNRLKANLFFSHL